jgi:hypothetical protein
VVKHLLSKQEPEVETSALKKKKSKCKLHGHGMHLFTMDITLLRSSVLIQAEYLVGL